jgi:hypothetical protein
MVPRSILHQLAQLRRREVLLRLTWGTARWVGVVLAVLFVVCLVDWQVDREQDTPFAARLGLTTILGMSATWAAARFLVLPLMRGHLSNKELALFVEERNPQFQHRLISALQLNQPGALTEGMSPELITKVTQEAEERATQSSFADVADRRRLTWSAAVAGPALAVAAILFVLNPALVTALIGRQFLQDWEIPHAVSIVSISDKVRPSGEKVTLRFRVTGPNLENEAGKVLVQPDEMPADRYPLVLHEQTGPEEAIFVTEVPALSTDFSYRAWLGDGRMHRPQRVQFVPRPLVTQLTAWTLLPTYCDPAGKERYPQLQARGDIVGIRGSWGRVVAQIQKAVKTAYLEILHLPEPETTSASTKAPAAEAVTRRVDLTIDVDGTTAEATFDLRPDESAYRVVVKDQYGFENVPAPQRALRLVSEEPPQVALLREAFPPVRQFLGEAAEDDSDVEGMPVPLGGAIRIGYTCSGPYGLGQARLLFRVLNKAESGNEEAPEPKWIVLPLAEVAGSAQTGPFDSRRGVFANSGPKDQVHFHAVPALAPHTLGRTLGGGRFDFQTSGIHDGKGGYVTLKEGDMIEYCVEVLADRDRSSGRPSARSETRVKTMVSLSEFARWIDDTLQEERRIRQLDAQQRGVFEMPK